MHTLLILGGYGFFGERIAATLARDAGMRLLIGGRDSARSRNTALALGLPAEHGIAIDATAPDLAQRLSALGIDTLIHAAGPFQGQDYAVARAAIAAGCHYVDLADGRAFVAGIAALDAAAHERGVSVVSGASSVPGLSSAVVARYAPHFSRLDAIRIGIGSGARAPGLATMRGVFGYCGRQILRLENGRWTTTYGWLDLQRHAFPKPVGPRWLGSCDVPDLELLPQSYPGVRTVTFHAGFAGSVGHLAVWLGAWLVRAGLLKSMTPLTRPLHVLSGWMERFVSDKGGMFVTLQGVDAAGHSLKKTWHLIAARNHGPYIPCGAAIALARKLAAGAALPHGAYPCIDLLTVEEYLAPLCELDVRELAPS